MDITPEVVRRVAKLARLALTSAEEERLATELGQILSYVAQLQAVDTEDLEPTSHSIPLVNVMRPDTVIPNPFREELLANAPLIEQGMFRVPRIL